MSDFERYRQQIEDTLGRPILYDELVFVEKLSNLLPAQLEIARALVSRHIIYCAMFLRSVTDESVGATKRFMSELSLRR